MMGLRVLVCGDRHWSDKAVIRAELAKLDISCVIEGGARGADLLAREVAEELGIHVEEYKAEWDRLGRAAGPIRNKRMLDEGKPDLVLAFHSNLAGSKGTANMVRQAKLAGVSVKVLGQ